MDLEQRLELNIEALHTAIRELGQTMGSLQRATIREGNMVPVEVKDSYQLLIFRVKVVVCQYCRWDCTQMFIFLYLFIPPPLFLFTQNKKSCRKIL